MFNIQRFAVHDGPGIRTTVFVKGCPLECAWCHNPESLSPRPELIITPRLCIGCEQCLSVCEQAGVSLTEDGPATDRAVCVVCGRCVAVCPTGARAIAGESMSPEQVLAVVVRDRPFYETSGGGMTVSGGEPLASLSFTAELLRRAKSAGLHTAVDTSGHVPWRAFAQTIEWTDLYLYDVKHPDADRHEQGTGAGNQLVLANLARLAETECDVMIRVPLVEPFNADPESARALAALLASLSRVLPVEVLPYHGLGESKWERLGKATPRGEYAAPAPEAVEEYCAVLEAAGVPVRARGRPH